MKLRTFEARILMPHFFACWYREDKNPQNRQIREIKYE